MAAHMLHCPECGDLWKRVRSDRFIHIGPPRRQCRVCLHYFKSEEKEWPSLTRAQRMAFLAQNLFFVLPPAVLFALTIPICQFLDLVPQRDLMDYSFFAGLVLLATLALLLLWSSVQILRSIARARRARKHPLRPAAVKAKFVSDSAWQAAQAVRPRFASPHPATASEASPQPTAEARREPTSERAAQRKADPRPLHGHNTKAAGT